jgi:2-polyprenyl-3-methyl-5-hydroxy-6-metoxy-1,4-benzoquinol methylase
MDGQRINFNERLAEAFAGKMVAQLNAAGLALMTSLGHRTGLFDAMCRLPASTTHEIAAAATLSERYVREWLGAMTTGGIVLHDETRNTYWLPAEHAAFLTREASPNNIAASMQWIAVLGSVETHVAEAFRHGKGVPYAAYDRFHDVMAEESDQTTVAGLEKHIVPLVDGLHERLTQGIDVLDIACGAGRAITKLAELYPRSRFVGRDLSTRAVAMAREAASTRGLKNVRYEATDLADMQDRACFDLITGFDAIHDQAQPAGVLRNVFAALRPGGLFLMQDIKARTCVHHNLSAPLGPFTYTISCMHCMSVSLANGGPGLGAAWGKELALSMLSDAGFGDVKVHELPHDMVNYYYLARP